ncbi:porin family protein [Polaribacter sp. Z014]|uniref:outer membrane beta-barrel protein n=1 Tax=Polaribacter sp. Z014 TaxID=2927126 RepID=UPI0020204425|nr:outer membrane beta-barrel protein [Polaribacter sp. Z014]MCL7764197.1 porin family protein [Polaribacter sp. Z014]
MKKLLVMAAFVFAGLGVANAQEGSFNAGVNLGIPTGDSSDAYSFAMSVEANYLFDVSESFKVGPSVSYSHYLGKNDVLGSGFDVDDASFLPIAAAGRYAVSDKFTVGADLGYGIGISPDENDGGFYYRPMVGYSVSEKVMIQASYSAVDTDGITVSNFGVGAMFAL